VREAAQSLLAHLPESAFVGRMTARADAMLSFKRSALARVGLGKGGSLVVSPPESMDKDADADRDGLGKPPQGVGAKAYWLARTLAAVPVGHWEARFELEPAELVAAAEATDWAGTVCEGWARSAIVGEAASAEWLGALWEMFLRSDEKTVAKSIAYAMAGVLLQKMTPDDAATRVEALFASAGRVDIGTALLTLPSPWPVRLGERWMEMARRELAGGAGPSAGLATLRFAALALPAECLERAIGLGEALSADSIWAGPLADFVDVVRLRYDLVKEIAT
jgi:hypothetical protein